MLEYDLDLDVDFPSNRFRGSVSISGVREPGPFELDAVDLAIESVRSGATSIPFHVTTPPARLLVARPSGSTEPVRISYSGKAGEGVQTGFFVARLGTHKALSTQMEPESCRRLLPCFDRPDRKAVFRLRVTTDPGLVVISNMPSEARPSPNGRSEWTFPPTPPMATYLFYLGIGPFEETVDDDGPTRIVVAGPAGRRAPARRTARLARAVLRGFTEYFDVPYPLPKLHFVALSDFWAGMENWGAISGSEDQYLLDESASAVGLEFGDEVVAHETAHQWFGDLVTLRTWDDLWLNEAFATYAVPRVREVTKLSTEPWVEFAMLGHRADRLDALWTTHPVKPATLDAAEIMANADDITYMKGARLLRMVEKFVGFDRFRDGLSEYLRDHQFGNASSDDLWAALEEESGEPVAKVMRTWVERPGHPVVEVRQNGPDVELSQRRFTFLPRDGGEPPWPIPLRWSDGTVEGSVVFDSERLTLPGRNGSTLALDPGRQGFFRLLLAPELRGPALAKVGSASPEERWGILRDAEGFLYSGDYSLEEYLALLAAAGAATDRLTVEGAARALDGLLPVLGDVPSFGDAVRRFCAVQVERLGEEASPGEPEGREAAREWLLWVRARCDDDYARRLRPRFARLPGEPRGARRAVLTAWARGGASGSVEQLFALASGSDPDLAGQASFALGYSTDLPALRRALERAPGSLPLVNVFAYLLPSVGANEAARPTFWAWLQEQIRELERRSEGTGLLALTLRRTLPYLGIGRADEMREFFAREKFPEARPSIEVGLELLEVHERLRARVKGAAPSQTGG